MSLAGVVQHVEEVLARAHSLFGEPTAAIDVDAGTAGRDVAAGAGITRAATTSMATQSGFGPLGYRGFAGPAGHALDTLAGADDRLAGLLAAAATTNRSGQIESGQVVDAAAHDIATLMPATSTVTGQRALLAALRTRVGEQQGIVDATTSRDAELSGRVRDLATSYSRPPESPLIEQPVSPSAIPVGTPPEEVKRWWDSLTPAEKAAFLQNYPDRIGNLDGIPCADRDVANRAVLARDLSPGAAAAATAGVDAKTVAADPGRFGLSGTEATRFGNAWQTNQGLMHQAGPDPAHPYPTLLLAYDPTAFDAKGRAAISIGNPDTAASTAVIVPGTSSSVAGGWLSDGHNDALNLFEQSARADPNRRVAVVSWMGYDAPNSFSDERIATPWLARTGGEALAGDVNAFSVTHRGDPGRITVLGHSYGSTTVADAAASGMRASDVVLLGCPGTDMAHSVNDFHLGVGGHVWVGDASTDPVGWLGVSPDADLIANAALGNPLGPVPGLGTDPAAASFGATRFAAEVPGSTSLSFADHSHYYTMGSESLRAMTDITVGRASDLGAEHLLVGQRHTPVLISTPDHLDLPWGGRVPLPHLDIKVPGALEVTDPEWDRTTVSDSHQYR